jgi:hypothetical protein
MKAGSERAEPVLDARLLFVLGVPSVAVTAGRAARCRAALELCSMSSGRREAGVLER